MSYLSFAAIQLSVPRCSCPIPSCAIHSCCQTSHLCTRPVCSKLVAGLEVDLELITDRLELTPFVFLVPRAPTVLGVGVRLPMFEFLARGEVIHLVIRVGVTVLSAGRQPLLPLLLFFLLLFLHLAMPVLGVGLNRGAAVVV